jgi:hypothetical protein
METSKVIYYHVSCLMEGIINIMARYTVEVTIMAEVKLCMEQVG